ncbi:MAG: hypothetical protein QOE59_2611, partial [Actinomycetota bacterium]|nr:hypothetical protein [Actinomycetota bacterium]
MPSGVAGGGHDLHGADADGDLVAVVQPPVRRAPRRRLRRERRLVEAVHVLGQRRGSGPAQHRRLRPGLGTAAPGGLDAEPLAATELHRRPVPGPEVQRLGVVVVVGV